MSEPGKLPPPVVGANDAGRWYDNLPSTPAAAALPFAPVDEPSTDEWEPTEERPVTRTKPQPSGLRSTVEWVGVIAGALLVAVLIRTLFLQTFFIPSESMESTLKKHDRVLVNKLSYKLHDINRGDVVVFRRPPKETNKEIKDLIKRVVGLPGESVEGRDGHILIDGKLLTEPYLDPGRTTGDFGPTPVPDGMIFVMGDNRGNSEDSRVFGAIDQHLVVGRAFVRIWPFGRFGWL
jgi:signal peptidase I